MYVSGVLLAEPAQAPPSSSASSPPAGTTTATSEVASDGVPVPAMAKKDGVQTSCCTIFWRCSSAAVA